MEPDQASSDAPSAGGRRRRPVRILAATGVCVLVLLGLTLWVLAAPTASPARAHRRTSALIAGAVIASAAAAVSTLPSRRLQVGGINDPDPADLADPADQSRP